MRRITARDFQRNFFVEVRDLPFEVVKNGVPFLKVEQLPGYEEELRKKQLEKEGRQSMKKCQYKDGWKFCPKYSVGSFPWKYNDNEGNYKTIDLYLCDEHSRESDRGEL